MLQLKLRFNMAKELFGFYNKQEMWDHALPVGIKMTELFEQINGSDCFAAAEMYVSIADWFYDKGYEKETEILYKRALSVLENSQQAEPKHLIHVMYRLGDIATMLAKPKEAVEMYQLTLVMAGHMLSKTHPFMEEIFEKLQFHLQLKPGETARLMVPNAMSTAMSNSKPNQVPLTIPLTDAEQKAEINDQILCIAVAFYNRTNSENSSQNSDFTPPVNSPRNEGLPIASELDYWTKVGNTGKIKLALQRGEDLNQRWENGRTALHTAAAFNRVEVIKLLLSAGANVNAQMASGETALDIAKTCGYEEAASILASAA